MKTTASGNFEKNKTWDGVKKHNLHDPKIKHSNEYLNSEESKHLRQFNRRLELIDFKAWTEQKFSKYVLSHDKTAMKKSRMVYGSVENFLRIDSTGKKRKKTLDKLFLEKFSNKDDYDEFCVKAIPKVMELKKCDKQKAKDIITKVMADSLVSYAKGFNTRNKHIKMFIADIHVDEEGTPHLHSRIMPLIANKDSNKKPSWSLNKAFQTDFKVKKAKDGLVRFRAQEDQALIDAINGTFKKRLPELGVDFELIRKKPTVTGVKHEIYKIEKQKEAAQAALDTVNKQLAQAKADVKIREDTVAKREQAVKERENIVKTRESQIKPREEALLANEYNYMKNSKKLVERENRLNEREQNYNYKLVPKYNDKVKKLNNKLDTVSQKEKHLDNLVKQNEQMSTELNTQLGIVQHLKDVAKDTAKRWKDNAYALMWYVFHDCKKFFASQSEAKKELFESQANPAKIQLNWYKHNIMGVPDATSFDDIKNHFNDHQYNWLTSHKNDKKVSSVQKTIEKAKKLQKKGRDENADGIDDAQEASLSTIDVSSVDPLLAYNNEKEAKKEDQLNYDNGNLF